MPRSVGAWLAAWGQWYRSHWVIPSDAVGITWLCPSSFLTTILASGCPVARVAKLHSSRAIGLLQHNLFEQDIELRVHQMRENRG